MRGAFLVAVVLFGAAACDSENLPPGDLWIRVTVDVEQVAVGRPFPLTVERAWPKDLLPETWSDDALAPLILHPTETLRREDDGRVVETRRYRAVAATLEDIALPAPSFSARPAEGGEVRTAVAEPIEIRVVRALDPEAPGDAELPGGLLESGPPWALIGGTAVALLLGAAVLVRSRRRRRPVEDISPADRPHAEPPPGPGDIALEGLRRLEERDVDDDQAIRSFYDEGSTIVRTFVAERFSVRTVERTTEEILAEAPVPAADGEDLAAALGACDLVKYARDLPGPEGRSAFLATARRVVRAITAERRDGP